MPVEIIGEFGTPVQIRSGPGPMASWRSVMPRKSAAILQLKWN
jgi:hypothetical protein